jgi:hypothetical protein
MAVLPPPGDASRVSCFLADHPRWSAWWDKKYGLWRVAEDDPDSDLYAESSDADNCDGLHHGARPRVHLTSIVPVMW